MSSFTMRLALILVCLGVFSVQGSVAGRVKRRARTCRKEFYAMKPHTMCLEDSPGARAVAVSPSQQRAIVDLHNYHRAHVRPSATDLTKLIWDDALAEVAEKWAMQCYWDHDKHAARAIPKWGITIGQNMAKGHRSWENAINAWQAEVKDYRYGLDPDTYVPPGVMIGHYTQMVQSDAQRVGCGQADCSGTPFYVCNYARGQSKMDKPYTLGRQCSACPGYCRDGLCDCGGRVCKNGGTLEVSTCSCNCTKVWEGRACEKLNCPPKDHQMCGRKNIIPENCKEYSNLPHDCPYMCGICGDCKGRFCINGGTLDTSTCRCKCPDGYEGESCEKLICPDTDNSKQCGRGKFIFRNCEKYSNLPEECPYMCGACGNCKGTSCQNGGTLDPSNCSCRCTQMYEGRYCEQMKCPPKDLPHCGSGFPPSYCNVYRNVPEECPYMCGKCR